MEIDLHINTLREKKIHPFFFSFAFGFIFIHNCIAFGSEDEERLVRDLFRGYNKLIRPVQNMTQTVDVRFGLAFVQLINVVSKLAQFYFKIEN